MRDDESDRATRYLLVATGGSSAALFATLHNAWDKPNLAVAILDVAPWIILSFIIAVVSYVCLLFIKSSWTNAAVAYRATGLSKKTRNYVRLMLGFSAAWIVLSLASVGTLSGSALYAVYHIRDAQMLDATAIHK